jgi:hypothetical protein
MPVDLAAENPAEGAAGSTVGRMTSTAAYKGAYFGLGIVRAEAAERHPSLHYSGGTATILKHSPFAAMAPDPSGAHPS